MMTDFDSQIVSTIKISVGDGNEREERISFDRLPLKEDEIDIVLPILIQLGVISLHGFTNRNEPAAKPVFTFHREKCGQFLAAFQDPDLEKQAREELETQKKAAEAMKADLEKQMQAAEDKDIAEAASLRDDFKNQADKRQVRLEAQRLAVVDTMTGILEAVKEKRRVVDDKIKAIEEALRVLAELNKKAGKNAGK